MNIFPFKLEIRAGTRNPENEKASKLRELPGVTVVQAEMGNKESMSAALKGRSWLFKGWIRVMSKVMSGHSTCSKGQGQVRSFQGFLYWG